MISCICKNCTQDLIKCFLDEFNEKLEQLKTMEMTEDQVTNAID